MDSLYLPKFKSENSKRTTFFATYRQQSFSLPVDSIIYYILMNPTSPEVYQKLIQSCKYFFINNPILVTLNFIFNSKNGCHTLINETLFSLNNVGSKFWIVDSFTVGNNDSYKACSLSTITSKIYQCDAKKVTCWNQNTRILYKDFIFVSSKCQELHLLNAAIMYEDDSIVTLEKIVEALPKLTILAVQLHDTATKVISSKTVYELLKISHFSNLENLRLFNIPQCFDIDCFFKYIKKNKEIKSALDFSSEISDEYKKQLEAIVEEIVEKETHDYKVPWICFSGIDYTSFGKIKMLVSRQL